MKRIFVLVIFALLLSSCGKDFLERQPLSDLTQNNFYKTEKDMEEAVLAVYSVLQGPRFYGFAYYQVMEMSSDDITTKLATDPHDDFQWSPIRGAAGTVIFEDLWALYYEGIYRANLVLNNIDKSEITMSASSRASKKAQALFLRGVFYWHLATSFGKGPIYTKPVETTTELYNQERTRDELFKQATDDLKQAKADMPVFWDDANRGKATKYAVAAMLGKTYLHWACYSKNKNRFDTAAIELREVVASGRYSLLKDFEEIFSIKNENNKESIFEIQYADRASVLYNGFYSDGNNAGEGTQRDLRFGIQVGGNQQGYSELIATQDWSLDLELGDPRIRQSLRFLWDTLSGFGEANVERPNVEYIPDMAKYVRQTSTHEVGQYYHVKKGVNGYTGIGGIMHSPANWPMIRYADVLLMLAEAISEGSGVTSEAVGLLNQIRTRAKNMKTPPYISNAVKLNSRTFVETINGANLLIPYVDGVGYYAIKGDNDEVVFSGESRYDFRLALVRERRAELAFEYHRFVDMLRWEALDESHPGAASLVFKSKSNPDDIKPYNNRIHSRLPIPQYQIDLSKGSLTQNPGY
jgi:hypothetical protein